MIRDRLQPGFTLLELLLALAVSTVLMGAVLMVTAFVARDRIRMRQAERIDTRSQQRLLEIIRRDMTNAREVLATSDASSVVLRGFSAIDDSVQSRTDRRVEVRYDVERVNGESLLVRRQQYLDERVPTKPRAEVVATGVLTLVIQPISAGPERLQRQADGNDDDGAGSAGMAVDYDLEIVYADKRASLRRALVLR